MKRGEEDVAAADARDDLDLRRDRAVSARLPALTQAGVAAALVGDQHVPRAELGDVLEREREVLPLVELLADERLRLALVRRDRNGSASSPSRSGSPSASSTVSTCRFVSSRITSA